ncbi:hypothetical protein ACOME3_007103 [Neoechinorhynchus agilis]
MTTNSRNEHEPEVVDQEVLSVIEQQLTEDEYVLALRGEDGKEEYLIIPDDYDVSSLLMDEEVNPSVKEAIMSVKAPMESLDPIATTAPTGMSASSTLPEPSNRGRAEDEVLLYQTKPVPTPTGFQEESFVRLPRDRSNPPAMLEFCLGFKENEDGFVSGYQQEFLNFLVEKKNEDDQIVLGTIGRVPADVDPPVTDNVPIDLSDVALQVPTEPMDIDE